MSTAHTDYQTFQRDKRKHGIRIINNRSDEIVNDVIKDYKSLPNFFLDLQSLQRFLCNRNAMIMQRVYSFDRIIVSRVLTELLDMMIRTPTMRRRGDLIPLGLEMPVAQLSNLILG